MPIKMTKTLPDSDGEWYWTFYENEIPIIVNVDIKRDIAWVDIDDLTISSMGGYWAKVETEHFEFEG